MAAGAVVLLLSASASAQEKVLLRCRFKPGETYAVTVTTEQDMTHTLPEDRVTTVKQVFGMELTMNVVAVDADGTAEVRVTFSRITLKAEAQGLTLDFDSADPEKDKAPLPVVAALKALVGKSLALRITARGDARDVRGVKEIRDDILDDQAEGMPRAQARQMLDNLLNEDQVGSACAVPCPEDPVGVGDTWNQTRQINAGAMKMRLDTVYRVVRITPDAVALEATSTFGKGGEPDPKAQESVTIESGTLTGPVAVKRANALLVDADVTGTIKMIILTQGITVKSEVKTASKSKVTRK